MATCGPGVSAPCQHSRQRSVHCRRAPQHSCRRHHINAAIHDFMLSMFCTRADQLRALLHARHVSLLQDKPQACACKKFVTYLRAQALTSWSAAAGTAAVGRVGPSSSLTSWPPVACPWPWACWQKLPNWGRRLAAAGLHTWLGRSLAAQLLGLASAAQHLWGDSSQ